MAVELQYILASLGFFATILGISAGIFPRAKYIVAPLAFSVACGVLFGNYLTIKSESILEKEAQCESDMSYTIGLMSVKERVIRGLSSEMTRIDANELLAISRIKNIPKNLDLLAYQSRVHYALGGDILSEHMGNVDITFEKFNRDRISAIETVGLYGCELIWNSPPSGRFSCKCHTGKLFGF